MEVRARYIVEGMLSGMHRSPYFGQSVEFLQHRQYSPGDDLRHVDWKVWAKQDRLYVKQFEEETNLRATLMIDVSASMQYGSGPLNKYEYACTAAVSLAYLLLKQNDAVGGITFDESIRNKIPQRSTHTHLAAIIQSLSTEQPRDKTELSSILTEVAESYSRRGVVLLFSDLLCDPQPLLKGLRLLRQRGHDVIVFQILDDDELEFPFTGPTRFEGLESNDSLQCNPRALREDYLQAMQSFLAVVKRGCARMGADYTLIRTSDSLDAVLARYLSHRLESRRK